MRTDSVIGADTAWVLLFSGLIFLWALVLGVWKWQSMVASPKGVAHPYVDIAHRAALLYSFATALVAVFVELSGWPTAVNAGAAAAIILLFVITITNYIRLGLTRETENQMRDAPSSMRFVLAALIVGEIGGFSVLLAGFAAAEL